MNTVYLEQPQDQRGAANGLSVSLASVFKAIGPAGGGALFAWGQKRPDTSILPGMYSICFHHIDSIYKLSLQISYVHTYIYIYIYIMGFKFKVFLYIYI
jgi:hypothetical protein